MAREWDETIVQPRTSAHDEPFRRHSPQPRRRFPPRLARRCLCCCVFLCLSASVPFLALGWVILGRHG